MRISDALARKLLIRSSSISDEQMTELKRQLADTHKPLQQIIVENGLISEAELTRMYAEEIGLPYTDLPTENYDLNALSVLPERLARKHRTVVFKVDPEHNLLVAVEEPHSVETLNFLKKRLGSGVRLHIASSSDISRALDQYRQAMTTQLNHVDAPVNSSINDKNYMTRVIDVILENAINMQASIIHIEPRNQSLSVRFRIDGVLKEVMKLPKASTNLLVSSLAELSGCQLGDVGLSGQFSIKHSGDTYQVKVSIVPLVEGSKIVLHIVNSAGHVHDLTSLGFWGKSLKEIQHGLVQPHGLIVVTGPMGSGKTTTLFSMLASLNSPHLSVATVESIVSYKLNGVNQLIINEVDANNYVLGMNAQLQQDPNVLMVEDVLGSNQAALIMKSAMHQHLLLAGLSNSDGLSAIKSFIDMGIETYLVAATLRLVVSSRLARRLCEHCKQAYKPNKKVYPEISNAFMVDEIGGYKALHKLETSAKAELNPEAVLGSSLTGINTLYKANLDGCDHCNHSGYKGRINLNEVIAVSEQLQVLLAKNAATKDLHKQVVKDGTIPIKIDGLIIALRGITSPEEVLRVIQ